MQLTKEVKKFIQEKARKSCSAQAIATSLGISDSSLADNKAFAESYKKARGEYLIALHEKQYDLVFNARNEVVQSTQAIWLGKQDLGQSDKREETVRGEVRQSYVFVLPGGQRMATATVPKTIDSKVLPALPSSPDTDGEDNTT